MVLPGADRAFAGNPSPESFGMHIPSDRIAIPETATRQEQFLVDGACCRPSLGAHVHHRRGCTQMAASVVQEQGALDAPLTRMAYTGLIGLETYVLGVWASQGMS